MTTMIDDVHHYSSYSKTFKDIIHLIPTPTVQSECYCFLIFRKIT